MADDQAPVYPRDECKSCHAPILWAVDEKTRRPMPIDYDPVAVNGGGGDVLLTPQGARAPLAHVVKNQAKLFGAKTVYRRHFTTCPFAENHRPRRAAQRRVHA